MTLAQFYMCLTHNMYAALTSAYPVSLPHVKIVEWEPMSLFSLPVVSMQLQCVVAVTEVWWIRTCHDVSIAGGIRVSW